MVGYFILGVALVIGVALAAKWYVTASPHALIKMFKWLAIFLILLVLTTLILTRNLGWALLALPALIPWFLRARQASRLAKNWQSMQKSGGSASGPSQDNVSEIETKYLRMYLIHETGEMNGSVISGKFSGSTLMSLSFEDLIALMETIRDDNQSTQVLGAYMERYHAETWQSYNKSNNEAKPDSPGDDEPMTREEALKVLGLKEGVTESDIKEAHRRLMSKIHPDHGGSNYLATLLNKAKEHLIDQ
ncbi:MAG: hypothetical protein VX617_06755 [Pseudomonadota bacterium]|nr:hypothetical protein [Pseudomonadota bacterium]